MKKKLKSLLLCGLFLTSCNDIRVIEAKNNYDYYCYSIGEGQTVYTRYKSIDENEELIKFNENNITDNNVEIIYSIKSVITDSGSQIDENVLSFSNDVLLSLSITCLKPFDDVIRINKIIYECNVVKNVQYEICYNIELTFNNDYEYMPPFPTGYSSAWQLGVVKSGCLISIQRDKHFYIYFNKYDLNISKINRYNINGVSFNNDLVEILNIDYAIIPINYYYHYSNVSDLEYQGFIESLYLTEYDYGIILRIKYDIANEKVKTIGCDLNFDIDFNGDSYRVPYCFFYTSKLW